MLDLGTVKNTLGREKKMRAMICIALVLVVACCGGRSEDQEAGPLAEPPAESVSEAVSGSPPEEQSVSYTFRLHADLPQFSFTLYAESTNVLDRIEVCEVGGDTVCHTMELPRGSEPLPAPLAELEDLGLVRAEDINFDGYLDIVLVMGVGFTLPPAHYWLFEPDSGGFADLGGYSLFEPLPETGELMRPHPSCGFRYGSTFDFSPGLPAVGRINAPNLRVRSQPGLKGEILVELAEGAEVTVTAVSKDREAIGEMEDFWYRIKTADDIMGWAYGYFIDLTGGGPPSFEAGWDNPRSYEVVTVRYERAADGVGAGPLGFAYRDPLMDDTASDLTADVDADGIWRMRYRGSIWVRVPDAGRYPVAWCHAIRRARGRS